MAASVIVKMSNVVAFSKPAPPDRAIQNAVVVLNYLAFRNYDDFATVFNHLTKMAAKKMSKLDEAMAKLLANFGHPYSSLAKADWHSDHSFRKWRERTLEVYYADRLREIEAIKAEYPAQLRKTETERQQEFEKLDKDVGRELHDINKQLVDSGRPGLRARHDPAPPPASVWLRKNR